MPLGPNPSELEKCLAVISHGALALHNGDLPTAETSLYAALALARSATPDQTRDLIPLVLFNLSLLFQRLNRLDDARKLRAEATARIESSPPTLPVPLFQHLMALALMNLAEYRRAIPFYECAIQLDPEADPIVMAERLWRLGECYTRNGLKDHAAIPLRAAVKIFRKHTGDPRFPAALTTLGNALRKTAFAEAESCYREAADVHVARAQLLSATSAWVNLGILCSEQGRHAESLEHYERVLRVRQQSPGTPPERIASLMNNMANCYRRMGQFEEALASVDRAIALLEKEAGPGLAHAYGTRGLIFRDQGRDSEAVAWLRKAYEQHRKLPSPHLDTVVEDLENEIAALRRLGRLPEAAVAEEQLAEVRAAMNALPMATGDLVTADTPTRGAVLIELNFGSQSPASHSRRDTADLARRLAEAAANQGCGSYGGNVVVPENTTLIFYGPDAEALYQALQASLTSEPMCAGARVTIRPPGGPSRETVLPIRLM